MSEQNYIGRKVVITDAGDGHAAHPTENRKIQKGDLILISDQQFRVGEWFYIFDVDPKFGKENSYFGSNKQSLKQSHFEKANIWEGIVDLESLIQ